MATTTTQTESDPSRSRVLVLDESQLRARIVDHLIRARDAARTAAAHPDLATGVHDARKAARRVRAIADLVGDVLSQRERRRMHDAIRQARHALGPARDHVVAAHIIPRLMLDEPAKEAAKLVLHAATVDAPGSEETRNGLAEAASAVVAQVELLINALPPVLTFATVMDGVKSVYGRARRARQQAKGSKRAFHAWRRRSKELAYQLDVLGDAGGERLVELSKAVNEVARAQRDAVDLFMVRGFVRAHRHLVDIDAATLLIDALDAQLLPLLKDVRRAGKAAFKQKPRKLVRSACRDASVGVVHS
ncbi:MAG: CHAD domain-containing protein [Myxococcota bacterium]|nr:CHAD domain-containing protein [Myxococcota bacterium]